MSSDALIALAALLLDDHTHTTILKRPNGDVLGECDLISKELLRALMADDQLELVHALGNAAQPRTSVLSMSDDNAGTHNTVQILSEETP